ncbi:hypothetical protein DEDE109153_00500 [Deinococcus deserti]
MRKFTVHWTMSAVFRNTVLQALPSAERLQLQLASLDSAAVQDLADDFAASLPEFDLLLGLPGTEALMNTLARLRGVPAMVIPLRAHQTKVALPVEGSGAVAVLVTHLLDSGIPELQGLLFAAHHGLEVPVVAAAVERSSGLGRTRLELLNTKVRSAIPVADTPRGLCEERRTPHVA